MKNLLTLAALALAAALPSAARQTSIVPALPSTGGWSKVSLSGVSTLTLSPIGQCSTSTNSAWATAVQARNTAVSNFMVRR